MALQGLTLATSIGWIFGIVNLKRPWGRPVVSSWISLTSFISLLGFCIFGLFAADIIVNLGDVHDAMYVSKDSKLLTIINRATFVEMFISSFLVSSIFHVQAKEFAQLWGDLYDRNYEDAKRPQFYSGVWMNIAFSIVSALVSLGLGSREVMEYATHYQKSWVSFIGPIAYGVFVALFILAPFVIPMKIAYGCVGCTLHHLEWVYVRFCKKIREMMALQSGRVGNLNEEDGETEGGAEKSHQPQAFKMTPELKEQTYDEFERIQDLFFLSESTMSPLVLIMLSGGTLSLVLAAARIVFRTNFADVSDPKEKFLLTRDIILLLLTSGFVGVLQVGQKMLETFAEWKEKLQTLSIEIGLAADLSYEARDMNDLHLMIRNWNWKFSACGFFDVDKRLVSGIISLLLTYTVILVQINITIDGPDARRNNTSSNLAATANQ